jgi:hypothetical protein
VGREHSNHPPKQKQVKWSVSSRRIVMNGLFKGIAGCSPIQAIYLYVKKNKKTVGLDYLFVYFSKSRYFIS